jgi:diaminopimelate epimerase
VKGLKAEHQLIKAQAYGNDFLIAPVADGAPADGARRARQICDRRLGVGADGLIFATITDLGAETELFNSDGSRAEVSGNGVRCVAAWLAYERALKPGSQVIVGTGAGPKRLTLLESSEARATFEATMGHPTGVGERALDLHGETIRASVLSMGNPHCVVFGDLTDERLERIGRGLATLAVFPEGTNVELARLEAPDRVRMLIWERGVGPTASSGTGSCAAAVAAIAHHGASRRIEVAAPGGLQRVEWTEEGVSLVGWAELVARMAWPFSLTA